VIRADGTGARIGLVATEALLLGGDQIDIEIEVGPGCWLELVETAGTVAYDANGVSSSWTVRIRVGAGGVLLWAGEPFVVSHGANVRRRTVIDLDEGAVACLRETIVLGRTGETGGAIRSHMSVRRSQKTLLEEDLDLTDIGVRRLPGILGSARVIDSAILLGMRAPVIPELHSGQRFDLDGPGSVARSLGSTLVASPVGAVSRQWSVIALDQTVSAATTS
jgi:urease accessory protein